MTKNTKELQNLTIEEIKARLNELRKELIKENVQVSSGTAPSNPGKLKQTKKNIARLLTISSQKTKFSGGLEAAATHTSRHSPERSEGVAASPSVTRQTQSQRKQKEVKLK